MAQAAGTIAQRYQQPLWGHMDKTLRNCFKGAAAVGLVILIAVLVAPVLPPEAVRVNDLPERIARLILEKPKPLAPAMRAPAKPIVEAPVEPIMPKPKTQTKPRRRTSKPKVTADKGTQGRQKAQKEVTQNLAAVSGSLDKVLDNISKSLPTSESASKSDDNKPRRRRGVRSGRSSRQLSSVQGAAPTSSADISNSAIESNGISISSISEPVATDAGGQPTASAGAGANESGRNDLRSNDSLLRTVRRYAPGIQFCYDNELKKNPGLRGKMVVNITVLANGSVSEAFVVDDTLGSDAVTSCILSQIRGWRFAAIPDGVISFKTPFVFTPPN